MVLTVKHGNHFELHPERFKQAQERLQQLKKDLQPFPCPLVVRCVFRDQPYSETLTLAVNQLDLYQVDTTLGKKLVDLAQKFITVIRRPNVPEDLSNGAHRVLSLLAIMKRLFASVCVTGDVTIQTASVVVFFLMTVYTMELCEMSLQLAEKLYHRLNKKAPATESKDYVIPAYIQTIDSLMNLQLPNSLMSDILTHVQPADRLGHLRELLHQLVLEGETHPPSDANESFDSNLPQFDVMIGFSYEMRETFVPGFLNRGLHRAYAVDAILGSQTIDPSVLSPEIGQVDNIADHEASTLDSGYDPAIFSDGTEEQDSETTYERPDTPGFFKSEYERTCATRNQIEDLACIGSAFNNIEY